MKIIVFIFIILHWLTALTAIRIPFVRNVTLVLKFDWNTTTLQNHTCIECLCSTVLTNVTALNCFSNNTCQFFFTVPRTYNLQHTPQTFLYFPNGIFPNASQYCMPNLTYVIERLKNATQQITNTLAPRCLVLDDQNRLATVETSSPFLNLFDATTQVNLSRLEPSLGSAYRSLVFNDDFFYVGLANSSILMLGSSTLSVRNTIVSPSFSGIRDMIFLNDWHTMVVTSGGSNRLAFFNRSASSSTNYTLAYQQSIACTSAHGMWRVNDTFFYVTS